MLDPLTTILMLGAGLLHASWHAVIKSGADRVVLLGGMSLVAGVIAACAIPLVAFPSGPVWLVIAASVVLHVGYKLALARTYAIAGLGQAFPLARGFVPLFATVIAFAALGELPGRAQLVGIALVSAGLLWLAYEALRNSFDRWVVLAACIAGSTVAGYTALDAYGTRLAQDWASFTVWLIVSDCAAYVVLVRIVQPQGITLLIEPINQRDRPDYFLNRVEQAADIIAKVGQPNVKIQFDFYHVQIASGDLLKRFEKHQPLIGHVQIGAVPSRHEPDEGEINYPEVFRALDRMGYPGWVACEYRPRARTEDGLGWARPYGVVPAGSR